MSLIERAVKRMDQAPVAPLADLRAESQPGARETPDDAPFAPDPVPDGLRHRIQPVAQPVHAQPVANAVTQFAPSDYSRAPQRRPEPETVGDDEWATPAVLPIGAGAEGKAEVKHSKLVTIDLQRLREGGMIAPDGDKTPLAEEFRVIKRPLLKNAFGNGAQIRNGNLIMVTSAFPREGKSFCAINLAMSIAMERDRTVLLVDADVARPSIPQKFGIAPDVGLMDVLLDSHVSLSDAIVRTNVNKLALLPAGRPHRQATELLASEAMANLLAELSERYSDRIVIFDSPPLLVTTEARTLAANMGQIVMVVESDNTTHEALREALSTIESCDVVGMVLNKGRRSNPGDSYGYYGY